MTTILDMPVHPLAVHAPVVLVPLLVLFGLIYVLVPPLRRFTGWVAGILTLVAPAVAYGAIWSGEQFADHLYPGGWPQAVTEHHDWAWRLLWVLIGLVPVWLLFAALERGRRAAIARNGGGAPAEGEETAASNDDPAAGGRKVVMFVLGLIALVLLGLAGFIVFQAGDTGARMVWENTVPS